MEMIFHSYVNKTRFHRKGCALGLILKVGGFGTRKWPVGLISQYVVTKDCLIQRRSRVVSVGTRTQVTLSL